MFRSGCKVTATPPKWLHNPVTVLLETVVPLRSIDFLVITVCWQAGQCIIGSAGWLKRCKTKSFLIIFFNFCKRKCRFTFLFPPAVKISGAAWHNSHMSIQSCSSRGRCERRRELLNHGGVWLLFPSNMTILCVSLFLVSSSVRTRLVSLSLASISLFLSGGRRKFSEHLSHQVSERHRLLSLSVFMAFIDLCL